MIWELDEILSAFADQDVLVYCHSVGLLFMSAACYDSFVLKYIFVQLCTAAHTGLFNTDNYNEKDVPECQSTLQSRLLA